jgi:hypothetical protein
MMRMIVNDVTSAIDLWSLGGLRLVKHSEFPIARRAKVAMNLATSKATTSTRLSFLRWSIIALIASGWAACLGRESIRCFASGAFQRGFQ